MSTRGEDRTYITVAPSGGQTALTLTKDSPAWSADKLGGFSGVIIEVDDVYQPWGGWAMFKDSEGNIHGLHSPVPACVSNN